MRLLVSSSERFYTAKFSSYYVHYFLHAPRSKSVRTHCLPIYRQKQINVTSQSSSSSVSSMESCGRLIKKSYLVFEFESPYGDQLSWLNSSVHFLSPYTIILLLFVKNGRWPLPSVTSSVISQIQPNVWRYKICPVQTILNNPSLFSSSSVIRASTSWPFPIQN